MIKNSYENVFWPAIMKCSDLGGVISELDRLSGIHKSAPLSAVVSGLRKWMNRGDSTPAVSVPDISEIVKAAVAEQLKGVAPAPPSPAVLDQKVPRPPRGK